MSFEWRSYKIGEIGQVITGKTPPTNKESYQGSDVPFVTPPDFTGEKWIKSAARTISEEGAQSVKKCILPKNSVLVTCIGSDMGKAALSAARCVTNQQINAIVVSQDKFNPEFIFYNLSLRKQELRGMAGGSAQPILNKSAFSEIKINCPDLPKQNAIVDLIRPLDDRIALLHEINATLEAIAQAIFKTWFVDFDPVRAKVEGIEPEGMDTETAELFPKTFEESTSGVVPAGWSVVPLIDLVEIKGGKQLEKEFFSPQGEYPVFGGAGVMGRSDQFNADGFVITIGRVGAYCGQFFWHLGRAWVNNNSSQIKPFDQSISTWLYEWCKTADIESIKKGAAQPFVSNGDVGKLNVILPTKELIARYVELANPLYDKAQLIRQQSTTLIALRDALLPRLVSGQMRLPEAEEQFNEALTGT